MGYKIQKASSLKKKLNVLILQKLDGKEIVPHTSLSYKARSCGHADDHVPLYAVPREDWFSIRGVQGSGWAGQLKTKGAVIQQLKHKRTDVMECEMLPHN